MTLRTPARPTLLGAMLLLAVGCGQTDGGGEAPALGVATCTEDADCAGLDDGNACNGRVRCDHGDGRCRFDPTTVVACDATEDTACAVNRCAPATGACAMQPRTGALPCDDGEPCSYGDHCEDGACKAGATDLCACHSDADCPSDGDACNGNERCDTGVFPYRCGVAKGSAVVCDPAKGPCVQSVCDPKSGSCKETPLADGLACDDGENCTTADHCDGGECLGDPATDVSGCPCLDSSDCADDDGDPCTGVPFCSKAEVAGGQDPGVCKTNPATVVSCSSEADTACRKNACNPKSGACELSPVADETTCDDGDPCTSGEVCVAGVCAAGTDVCACKSDADCKDKEDGDLCNGTLFCNKQSGACEVNPATTVVCPTVGDTACSKNVCQPKSGECTVLPRAEVALVGCYDVDLGGLVGKQCLWKVAAEPGKGPFPCDDGSICTSGEVCEGKTCGGGKVVCECAKDADCPDKDGDICNGVSYCDKAEGKCKADPNSVVFCSKKDDSACLAAVCDPKTGKCALAPTAKGTPCDDGKLCTSDDACDAGGACVGAYGCDDGDKCTADVCDKEQGCQHKAKVCDDGNVCTSEACDKGTGACKAGAALATTTPCDADGSGCTVGDHCDGAGACVAGPAAGCKDPGIPCSVAACKSTSAQTFECITAQAKDGSACDDGDPCLAGESCKGGTCAAGKKSTLGSRYIYAADKVTDAVPVSVQVRPDGTVAQLTSLAIDGVQAWYLDLVPATMDLFTVKDGKPLAKPPAMALDDPVSLLPTSTGSMLALGNRTAKGAMAPVLANLDDQGVASTWIVFDQIDGKSTRLLAVDQHPSGNLVTVLRVLNGGKAPESLVVAMYDSSGGLIWSKSLGSVSGNVTRAKILPMSDGSTAVAVIGVGGVGDGVRDFASLTATGSLKWSAQRKFPAKIDVIAGMFELEPGELTILLGGGAGMARWTVVDGSSGSLKVRSRSQFHSFRPQFARQIGKWIFAAADDSKGTTITRYDAVGNPQTSFEVPHASSFVLQDLAVDPARERIILTYSRQIQAATTNISYQRALSWHGAASCTSRGACQGKSFSDCDDGKPCTADGCTAISGCTHAPKDNSLCPSSSGCGAYGSCVDGACTEPEYGRVFVRELAELTDTPVKVAGRVTDTPDGKQGHGWVWEVNNGAIELRGWSLSLETGATDEAGTVLIRCFGMDSVAEILRRPNGEVLVYGGWSDAQYPQTAAVCSAAIGWTKPTADAPIFNGTVTPIKVASCPSCKVIPRSMALHTNGDAIVVWNTNKFGGGITVRRLDAKLETIYSSTYTNPGGNDVHSATSTAYGDSVAVGRVGDVGPGQTPFFLRRAPNGASVEAVEVKSLAGGAFLAATAHGNDVLAVGTTIHTVASRSTLAAKLNSAGAVLWAHKPDVPDQGELLGVASRSDGYVAVGTQIVGGPRHLLAVRRTEAGQTLWQRIHAVDGGVDVAVTVAALHATAGGSYLFGGWRTDDATPLWVHVSQHGYFTCSGSGACAAATQTCDDKNPCTADWCDAVGGCQHTAIDGCKP